MFSKLKELFNASNPAYINAKKILCPVEGEVVSIKEVNDPTFSEEILGIGLAVKPSVGRVVSPVDGTVALMFDTGHAVSIVADNGAEILIHVGLDTVALKGLHYTVHCATDDKVKAGQLLIEFDIDGIKADGYDIITPVVICNSSDYSDVKTKTNFHAKELDEIITLIDK